MPNGPLTSRLQHIQPGDTVLIGRKPTGTLLIHDLHPGRNLYLLGTGTGFAPWLAVIKDPETYERFDKVDPLPRRAQRAATSPTATTSSTNCRGTNSSASRSRAKLQYYPAVTREDFAFDGRDQRGRLTELLDSGRMARAPRHRSRWIPNTTAP